MRSFHTIVTRQSRMIAFVMVYCYIVFIAQVYGWYVRVVCVYVREHVVCVYVCCVCVFVCVWCACVCVW